MRAPCVCECECAKKQDRASLQNQAMDLRTVRRHDSLYVKSAKE